jgi:hypothetical protein
MCWVKFNWTIGRWYVRFSPESGHWRCTKQRLLRAIADISHVPFILSAKRKTALMAVGDHALPK